MEITMKMKETLYVKFDRAALAGSTAPSGGLRLHGLDLG